MKIHPKCESAVEKLRGTNNIFIVLFYAAKFYICWFIFTWTGRFLLFVFILGAFVFNLELHAIRPSARVDFQSQQKIIKLQKEWDKARAEADKSIFINPWNHEVVLKLQKYDFLVWRQRQIKDQIRILEEENLYQNGYKHWQNRFLSWLPKCILNSNIKRINRLTKWKVETRKKEKEEKEHDKLHKG